MQVLSNYLLNLLTGNAIALTSPTSGPLNGAQMILFTNAIAPTAGTVLSDLVQPTYTGYVKQAVTWGSAYTLPNGNYCVQGNSITWQMGDGMLPTTVMGMALVDHGATNLLFTEVFATPQNLVSATDAFFVLAQFANGNPGFGNSPVLP